MWQRIQTLYLGLAIILNLLLHLLNFGTIQIGESEHGFGLWGLISSDNGELLYSSYPLLGLNIGTVLLSLVVVFMFKKRQLQIKLSQLNLFLQVGFIAAIFFMIDMAAQDLNIDVEGAVNYSYATYVSIVPLVFIYLAIRAIKKDEALVRAADRIR